MWVNQILNYIKLKSVYQTYISNIGLMINLSEYPDYIPVQAALTLEVKNMIVDMYLKGTILLPDEDIIRNWKLESINDDLYTATWNNKNIIKGFTSTTDFLISRNQGDTNLYLSLCNYKINSEEQLYLRYVLTKELYILGFSISDFLFTEDGIEIDINNLDMALIVFSIIERTNKELYKKSNIESLEYLPMISIDEIKELNGGLIYRFNDKERPYVYSNILE